jgi:transcriptional regulator with XRE-family HTH domain
MEEVRDLRSPDPIDVHVGDRVRRRRRALGVTQGGLGDQVGLTFQQIQKYERGSNRISASKLYAIAGVLQAPIPYFFEGLPDPVQPSGVAEPPSEPFVHGLPLTPEEQQLVGWLSRVESRKVRQRVLELVRTLAEEALRLADSQSA